MARGLTDLRTDAPAFDAAEFDGLAAEIGEDGVREIVWIFETETRSRLRRLAAGGQDTATIVREMHTLKGAASTVASPRLWDMGRWFEAAAKHGVVPTAADLAAIEQALEAFLAALRDRAVA